MNKMIVLDVGVFDPQEKDAILAAVDAHIADGENDKAWAVLEPLRDKLDKMQAALRDMRLCDMTPELIAFNEGVEDIQRLHDNLEHEMTAPNEPELRELLARA